MPLMLRVGAGAEGEAAGRTLAHDLRGMVLGYTPHRLSSVVDPCSLRLFQRRPAMRALAADRGLLSFAAVAPPKEFRKTAFSRGMIWRRGTVRGPCRADPRFAVWVYTLLVPCRLGIRPLRG